jgi:hypothetical protein
MSDRPIPRRDHAMRRTFRVLLGLFALAIVWGVMRPTEARVRPYYVVQGASFGAIQPRILFVLDTSGSMSWRTQTGSTPCNWSECETTVGAATASRMATARAAIRDVVEGVGDNASFAFMTFDQVESRTPATGVPPRCAANGTFNYQRRFTWVNQYWGSSYWAWITRDVGHFGVWKLCQGTPTRPYAYLRWDNLGRGSVIAGNNQAGAVPPSPLISTATGQINHYDNSQRRVQWFDRFMGVRARLSDANDPTHEISNATIGDYGADDTTRDAEVRDHDFYYWPYVDGFPGYYHWTIWGPYNGDAERAGTTAEYSNVNTAQLYSPFYIDLSATGLPDTEWGPASREVANAEVLRLTSPMIEGGVDAGGPTPWRSVVGPIVASPTESNAVYSHTTVASYLGFVTQADTPDACSPLSAVLVTDGEPNDGEGGPDLYRRIADLRVELGVDVYVVGFTLEGDTLNNMACAGAGACTSPCNSPCDDVPADEWDTCDDPSNPEDSCAYVANNSAELVAALSDIVNQAIAIDLTSGQGSSINQFGVGASGEPGQGTIVQTQFSAYTEFPGWRGHVVRALCDDVDGNGDPMPHCVRPDPEFEDTQIEATFGPDVGDPVCPQSMTWDAGVCLQQTPWNERRLFSNVAGGTDPIPVSNADGTASAAFQAELEARGLLTSGDHDVEADAIVAFLLGRDAPDGWKLAGIASSSPVVVRRVPPFRSNRLPEVAINDPHCAGRLYGEIDAGALPDSLEDFARESNAASNVLPNPAPHNEYQEAVLVGDDMGVLHAFQLNSGNELWGFLPNELLPAMVAQAARGAVNMGQPSEIADHVYGVSATVNHGWAYDSQAAQWRHLGIFGFGPGGSELYALDLSHMSPESPEGPFEILWHSELPALKASYDNLLGQTWARPALSYYVPGDSLQSLPEARLVLGSGYPGQGAQPTAGRTLIHANAVTGEIIDTAELPAVTEPVFESTFGALVDPAIGSHCLSRYWAEIQETYIADPAGRLFRWDLGAVGNTFPHDADSEAVWGGNAQPVVRFPACEGTGAECTVNTNNRGEPFVFAPAVSASNRIDDYTAVANGTVNDERDQFLVALISGTPNDETIDGADPQNAFHSSLYLLVDDHRSDTHEGFSIPDGAPKSTAADSVVGATYTNEAGYLRLALSDIVRTRTITPFPGANEIVQTRAFSKRARPVRAPRIFVTGVVDTTNGTPVVVEGAEVYYVTYTVFEPGESSCNEDFYDAANDTWYFDQGSTYEITFRLVTDANTGFNFINGASPTGLDFGGGFTPGLTLSSVTQVTTADCPGGACGIVAGSGGSTPCDNNTTAPPAATSGFAVPTSTAQINGFTPVE